MQLSKSSLVAITKAFVFWAIFQAFFFMGGFAFLFPMLPRWVAGVFLGSALTLTILLMTWFFLKHDELTVKDIGLDYNQGSLIKFLISLFLGILLFGVFYLIYFLLTPIVVETIDGVSIMYTIAKILLLFIALGAMEEVVFRGYFLRKLDRAIGIRAAIYVTSIAFGLYHGITVDSITGPAVWGLLYGVLAYWSKGLAVPIGLHVGVNIAQALFNQKVKWLDGIWSIEVVETATPFTIDQVSFALQFALLVVGVLLIEYYLRVVRPK